LEIAASAGQIQGEFRIPGILPQAGSKALYAEKSRIDQPADPFTALALVLFYLRRKHASERYR
jgi:hypothetical protein